MVRFSGPKMLWVVSRQADTMVEGEVNFYTVLCSLFAIKIARAFANTVDKISMRTLFLCTHYCWKEEDA